MDRRVKPLLEMEVSKMPRRRPLRQSEGLQDRRRQSDLEIFIVSRLRTMSKVFCFLHSVLASPPAYYSRQAYRFLLFEFCLLSSSRLENADLSEHHLTKRIEECENFIPNVFKERSFFYDHLGGL